jgi:predicted phage terminase large subunit-like protein
VSDSKDPADPTPAIGDLLVAIAARSEKVVIPQYTVNHDEESEDAEVVALTKSDKPKMRDWYGEERAKRELLKVPEKKVNVRNHSRWAREYAARPKVEDQIADKLVTAAGRQELAKQFDAILARASFSEFFRQAWKVLEPSTELVWNWHLELMCNIVQAVFMDWLKTKRPGGGRNRHKPLVRNVIFNVPPGSSKPVSVEGFVVERGRGLVRLAEINVGDFVLTHRGRFREVTAVHEQGLLKTLDVVTGRGRVLRVAPDHPILTTRGWIEAGEIATTDHIAVVHATELSGTSTMPAAEARLIGYLIGDGCLSPNGGARFTNQDPETLADFHACAPVVGLESVDHARPKRYKGTGTSVAALRAGDSYGGVRAWLDKHEILGKNSRNKRTPAAVMHGDRDVIVNYLAAYWACDGGIQDRRDIPRPGRVDQTTNTVRIDATTISEGLARDHQALLQRLGLNFTLRRKVAKLTRAMLGKNSDRVGQDYVSWSLVASDQDTCARFMDLVAPHIRHEKRTRAAGLRRSDFDRVLNPEVVVSITPAGDAECRCLTVDEDESFVYQGVAVHNSAILARSFQAWAWIHCPGMKFICLSVNDDATQRDARAMRDLVRSTWYVESFAPKWKIKDDQDAVSSFANNEGGNRISMPIKSEIVGLRADCVAAGTFLATEIGDVSVEALHDMGVRGEKLPRVWSLNHETNELELHSIRASRQISTRPIVGVCADSQGALRCTGDHRVWTVDGYQKATHLAGHLVPTLRRSDVALERASDAVQRMLLVEAIVRDLPEGLHASTLRGGEVTRSVSECSTELLEGMFARREGDARRAESARDPLRELRESIRAGFNEDDATVLHENVRRCICASAESRPQNTHQVSAVSEGLRAEDLAPGLLHQGLREHRALDTNVGHGEFELLGTSGSNLQRESLGEPAGHDSSTGRACLCGLRNDEELSRDAGASHRRESTEQRARESRDALRLLPHDASQVARTSLLSDHNAAELGSSTEVDVYDIDVDGLHNFFARDVCSDVHLNVSNCILIDDPNNPKKAESKKERDEVNDLWDVNQFNRVNDMERSLRFGVQQRTNEADWTGHVVDQMGTWADGTELDEKGNPYLDKDGKPIVNLDGWLHVVLPAEFDPKRKFSLPKALVALLKEHLPDFEIVTEDPRTEDGDPIDHERMSKTMLAAERRRWAGTGNYVGQMLQSPSGAEGTMVQRQWWGWFRLAGGVRPDIDEIDTGRPRPAFCRTIEEQPATVIHAATHAPSRWDFDWIAISLDCASKKTEKGSNYGILVIAGRGGRRYVLDDRTQRGALHEIIAIVKELVLLWKPDKILVEEKAAGPDVMDTLREQMGAGDVPMVAIEGIEPGNTDKELRLEAAIPYLANGMVYLLDGAPWLEEFVNELSKFPHGVRDDRVDALSQALNHIRAKDDEWPDF